MFCLLVGGVSGGMDWLLLFLLVGGGSLILVVGLVVLLLFSFVFVVGLIPLSLLDKPVLLVPTLIIRTNILLIIINLIYSTSITT